MTNKSASALKLTLNETPEHALQRKREQALKNLGNKKHTFTQEERSKAGKNSIKSRKRNELRQETTKKIDEFFAKHNNSEDPPTDAELALDLGFNTSAEFKKAAKENSGHDCQDLFSQSRLKIEAFYEKQLTKGRNATGSIFKLKNMDNDGWQDVQEVKNETKMDVNQHISSYVKDIMKELADVKH